MVALCTWCASSDWVELDEASGVAVCNGPGHPWERVWEPPKHLPVARHGLPGGIAADLGLHEDLPELLVAGEWADTAVVEYRYGIAHPENYEWMLDRWGHVAITPRKYSVTSFIGSTLGDLSRHTNVAYKSGRGSGFFHYNSSIGFWTLMPVPDKSVDLSWETFAEREGLNPRSWPLVPNSRVN
jgi:hypothetical protein